MAIAQPGAPLYLNIGSHNEVSDSAQAGLAYISDAADYTAIKTIALRIKDTIVSHQARWNAQYDQNFIRACLKHDTAASSPNDLIQYLNSLPEVEVDPHNHFDNTVSPLNPNYNDYNYSDVACLLDSCGLPYPRTNMGGFIWMNFTTPATVNEEWTQYNNGPQPGNKFPGYDWRPVVAWGGGSPGHTNDYKSYGIWKPKAPSMALFGQHDTSKYLTVIGQGCDDGFVLFDTSSVAYMLAQLQSLIYFIQQQPANPNAFWTASIMINHKHFQSANYVERLGQLLTAIDPYVQNGQVVWATLTEKYNAWHSLHSNAADFFNYQCSNIPLAVAETEKETALPLYPNPATTYAEMKFDHPVNGEWRVYDQTGRLVIKDAIASAETVRIGVEALLPGMYFVQVRSSEGETWNGTLVRNP